MAEAAGDVPLVLYNPPYAKTQVGPELLGRLVDEVPQLIGIKVPGVDVAREVTHRLAVFVAGHTLASAYPEGAAGAYSNVPCLSPAGAVRWYEAMRTDPAAALDLEQRLRGFLDEAHRATGRGRLLRPRAGQDTRRHRRLGTDRNARAVATP